MSKNQFTGTAMQPQRNRKFCQFNNDQYGNRLLSCSNYRVFTVNNISNTVESRYLELGISNSAKLEASI